MSTAATPRIAPPAQGARIAIRNGKLAVPDNPIIPFIEGDGTGPDIWRASVRVMDAAVAKAYGGKRRIHWMEVYAGEKANRLFNTWLPDETVAACREYLVSIKGPLTTPVGGGIRSLNVALRQMLDLYVCLRPVRWFKGVPSPVKHPEKVDMVIFRENTEDIYAGIEFELGTADNQKFLELFRQAFPKAYAKIRFPESSADRHQAGLEGRLRAADPRGDRVRGRQPAQEPHPGAQGQYPEVHRRRLPQLGLPARRARVRRRQTYTWEQWERTKAAKGEKDANAEMDAARKSGRVLVQGCDRGHHAAAGADAPGGIRRHRDAEPERRLPLGRARRTGRRHRHRPGRQHQLPHRATRCSRPRTAPRPKYANLDKVNPGSVILSGEMMLRYMGWLEAADAIIGAMDRTIAQKT